MDTEACTANMMGTKLEVKMKKGETGSWAKLDIPRPVAEREVKLEEAPKVVLCKAPSVPQLVVQSRRRPLLGPSPG